MVTGGGTGGHLFPGIAVADEFLHRFPDGKVMFVGTGGLIDKTALARKSYEIGVVNCHGLKGKSFAARLKSLIELPASLFAAMRVIRRFKPQLVLGVGGYVTGPVVLAAKMMGVATGIHEQNSIPGITNRILGKIVDRIFISIPGSEQSFPVLKTILTGNPVRHELVALGRKGAAGPPAGPLTLLVIGGSQGAHRINELVPAALAGYRAELPEDFQVIHQTGVTDAELVRGAYARQGIKATVAPFIADMATVYRQADLVVSRAGATSLAELTVTRKPAILIPFPYAADNHQEKNGEFLVQGGAARMFIERELSAEVLGREIIDLVQNRGKREEMSEHAGRLARPAAAAAIVDECLALLRSRGWAYCEQ